MESTIIMNLYHLLKIDFMNSFQFQKNNIKERAQNILEERQEIGLKHQIPQSQLHFKVLLGLMKTRLLFR